MPGHWWLSCSWHAGTGDNLALLSFRKFIMSFKKKEDIGQSSFSWHMLRKNWRVLMIRDYPRMVSSLVMALLTNTEHRYFGCSFGCTNCSNCVVIYCYLQDYNYFYGDTLDWQPWNKILWVESSGDAGTVSRDPTLSSCSTRVKRLINISIIRA